MPILLHFFSFSVNALPISLSVPLKLFPKPITVEFIAAKPLVNPAFIPSKSPVKAPFIAVPIPANSSKIPFPNVLKDSQTPVNILPTTEKAVLNAKPID